MLVYVDDLLFVFRNFKLLEVVKNLLSAEFKLKVLGDFVFLLGVCIKRNRISGVFMIDQLKYAAEILRKFNMEEVYGVFILIVAGIKLEMSD